jgi:transposase-like protein
VPKKRYNAEEIIQMLRGADVLQSLGETASQTCKQIGVSDQTYYRWRKSYGGMKVDQAKRLKELEAENARLKLGHFDPPVHPVSSP